MATHVLEKAVAPNVAALEPPDRQHLLLHDISWSFYERLVEELGNRPGWRVAYDEGDLEIMSPLSDHEILKKWVARLIEAMAFARRLEVIGAGSTTFSSRAKKKGLEPDECYYVQHADAVKEIRGKFNPKKHQPPDLAVEVEVTSKLLPREPIYAGLKVQELWAVDEESIRCRILQPNGLYADAERSLAFPFLAPADLLPWMKRLTAEKSVVVLEEFTQWARELG